MSIDTLPALAITALLRKEPTPIFLIGAGASAKSGIPISGSLVELIAKWGYCKAQDRDFGDPTLFRSDWWPWLQSQSWYRPDQSLEEQYPVAVEQVLRPKASRRSFFLQTLNPGLPVSAGYKVLAQLLARGALKTILTTNFDQLIAQEARSTAAVHSFAEIRTPNDFDMFSTNPLYPQIIYLHGSVEHYSDQNIEQETQTLNAALIDLLRPALRDHPLVVIGYRGAEPSVMKHLLIDQSGYCAKYRQGIYWCVRGEKEPSKLPPLLSKLSSTVGDNLQFVEIEGFDELMETLRPVLEEVRPETTVVKPTTRAITAITHDLKPSSGGEAALDAALVRSKIAAYCEATRLPVPMMGTSIALLTAMKDRGLAVTENDALIPNVGAQLLFAADASKQIASAQIHVALEGPPEWVATVAGQDAEKQARFVLEGNLWTQLDAASAFLSRANKPFRLKGTTSLDVYPYPPLALKELLTNLIAHRDYSINEPSTIHVTPTRITFSNPGGLIDHVRKQLRDESIFNAIRESQRGIKGYRNPVVADFFYAAGAMDKKGSGLPDVLDESANNLNDVTFGPSSDNHSFHAAIGARPEVEQVDHITRTAKVMQRELKYSPNLLTVVRWPESIWKLGTIARAPEFTAELTANAPPFGVFGNWILTFCDPHSSAAVRLMELVLAEEIHQVPTTSVLSEPSATGAIVRLLNSALLKHLEVIGLRTKNDFSRIRAFFAADENDKPKEVTYRSLFRQSRRTVTKPIVSRSTGKTVFWEHKAVGLRFERFAAKWCLALTPGYVFSADGTNLPIDSSRIGPLSTKRAARDYNPTVLHDLVFWSRVLSTAAASTFPICLDGQLQNVASHAPAQCIEVTSLVPTVVFQEGSSQASESSITTELSDSELAELQAAIEDAIADSEPKAR